MGVNGKLLKKIDPLRKIMLYTFRGRNDSIVYCPEEIDLTKATTFLKNINKDRTEKITLFHLINAALARTICEYPELNRFVLGNKLYARNNFSVAFVVLKNCEGKKEESVAKVCIDLKDTIYEVSKKIDEGIKLSQSGDEKEDDRLMYFLSKLPSFCIKNIVRLFCYFANHGLVIASMENSIPLFSSIFISNLGSIGHDIILHHLYEFGTTSVFMTIGTKKRSLFKTTLDVSFSIDERIADGIELVKSLRYFKDLLQNPTILEFAPENIKKDRFLE